MDQKNHSSNKKSAPAKVDLKVSLSVLVLLSGLILAGYFLQKSGGNILMAAVILAAWIGLLAWALKKAQWLPLLTSTAYWLITSAIRLFLRDGESTGRKVVPWVEQLADFAATPLKPLSALHPDLPLLAMAGLTLGSLMGLIMILDQNKPKSEHRKDGSSDQTDWF